MEPRHLLEELRRRLGLLVRDEESEKPDEEPSTGED